MTLIKDCKFYFLILIITLSLNAFSEDSTSSIFPLYYYSSDKITSGTLTDLILLHPFVEYENSPEKDFFALRPIFSYERQEKNTESDFIYPIFNYKKQIFPDNSITKKWRVFPILYNKKKKLPDGKEHKTTSLLPVMFYGNSGENKMYFILFPFIWYAKNSSVNLPLFLPKEQNFAAFFPVYGDFNNFLGKSKMRFILFPIYTHSEKEGMNCDSFIWPITGFFHGEKIKGFRLFPLFGYTKTKMEEEKNRTRAYYLWPLGHHVRAPQTKENKYPTSLDMFFPLFIDYERGNTSIEYYFPFWGRKETPVQTTNSYLFPLLMSTENTKEKYKQHRIMGILLNRKKGENNKEFQLLNIYGYKEKPNRKTSYILWPIFSKSERIQTNHSSKNTYFFPFYSSQKTYFADGRFKKKYFLLPFIGGREEKNGEKFYRNLWLWWYTNNSSIERNWAPFWTFYESTKETDGDYKKSVFKKLYVSEKKDGVIEKEFNLLIYSYQKKGNNSKHKFFGFIAID